MGPIVGDSPSCIPGTHYTPCLLPVEPQRVPQPLPEQGQEQDSGAHTEDQGRVVPIRMEGTAWPGAGAVPLWDIHSQVFMETTHRTYVYQASDAAATSRLHLCSPCPGLGGYVCRGTCDATWPVPALLWPEPHCPFPCICWEVDPWEGEVSPPGVLIVGKRMLSAALTSRGGQRRSK